MSKYYSYRQMLKSNPAPIGLAGFGMSTILLNLHNVGAFPLNSMILGMGLFVGGIVQMIAGRLEFQKGNTFASVAFTLYGGFWLSLVFIFVFPQGVGAVQPSSATAMACYLLFWGVFSALMTVGTFKSNFMLRFIFISLTILFLLLAIENFLKAAGNPSAIVLGKIAGFEGILCALSALYLAVAEIINEVYGRTIFPIGA